MTDHSLTTEGENMGRMRSSTLVNRNVTIGGRRTSLRLEPVMWEALQEIAQREGVSVHELCSGVETARQESTLTAAIRVHILGYFRAAATEQGHSLAGHGRRQGMIGAPGSGLAGVSTSGGPSAGAAAEGETDGAATDLRPQATGSR